MIQELFRFYWYYLKNGRPKPDIPPHTELYGREDIKMNLHKFGGTALALVCGLAIGVSVIFIKP